MSGAVCPACGIAVMPGYARCPKCRKPLPRRLPTVMSGGTSVESTRRWPLLAAVGGVLIGVVVIVKLISGSDAPKAKPAPQAQPSAVEEPTTNQVDNRPTFQDDPPPTQQATGPDAGAVAESLERDLKRQRLWATVSISGSRVEVRSGSCADPAMGPMLDGVASSFKAAGLTKLRCVEQSGRVVSDRDL